MSSTSRGGKRSPADFYATPVWPVYRLLDELALPRGSWLEPAAGDGAIIRAVNAWRFTHYGWPNGGLIWTAVEKRKSCEKKLIEATRGGEVIIDNFLKYEFARRSFSVCISNDPFVSAMSFIEKTMKLATWNIHLLRLNFLGTEDRNEFFRGNMPDVYVIPDRVSFAISITCLACTWSKIIALDKIPPKTCPKCDRSSKLRISTSDSIEYAWFVWGPERNRSYGRTRVLKHTPLEERQVQRSRR